MDADLNLFFRGASQEFLLIQLAVSAVAPDAGNRRRLAVVRAYQRVSTALKSAIKSAVTN